MAPVSAKRKIHRFIRHLRNLRTVNACQTRRESRFSLDHPHHHIDSIQSSSPLLSSLSLPPIPDVTQIVYVESVLRWIPILLGEVLALPP